ncbi:hypothetical protein Tco_0578082 [Tanacetum coccineum]
MKGSTASKDLLLLGKFHSGWIEDLRSNCGGVLDRFLDLKIRGLEIEHDFGIFEFFQVQGVDVFSHCKIRIGNGLHTQFWKNLGSGDCTLSGFCFLEVLKKQQLEHLVGFTRFCYVVHTRMIDGVSDLNGDVGSFVVIDVMISFDEIFLPESRPKECVTDRSRVPCVMRFLEILLLFFSIVLWLEIGDEMYLCRWWLLGVQNFFIVA